MSFLWRESKNQNLGIEWTPKSQEEIPYIIETIHDRYLYLTSIAHIDR